MENIQTITIKEYLDKKGMEHREFGKELIVKCLFNACDEDSGIMKPISTLTPKLGSMIARSVARKAISSP